jgi:hypothetical protein
MIKYNQIHRMLTRTIEHCGHLERLEVASGSGLKGNKNDDWVGMVSEKTGIAGKLMTVPKEHRFFVLASSWRRRLHLPGPKLVLGCPSRKAAKSGGKEQT